MYIHLLQYATTLRLHGRWPSYKPYGVAANRIMDGCPTNCHTHVLTVTSKDDNVNDFTESLSDYSENGSMENGQQHLVAVYILCVYVFNSLCLQIIKHFCNYTENTSQSQNMYK